MKYELKEKSPIFRWLNGRLDPMFNRLRDAHISGVEKQDAISHAAKAMSCAVIQQVSSHSDTERTCP